MEQEQLTEFKIQLALPAPNIEIAQEVANKAQVLINQFGYRYHNSPYTCHHNLMKVFIMVYIILPM
jgi:hypothetical protein